MFAHLPLLLLLSCAAALVPETSDPNEKLKQSYELVSLKRGIAAEKVIDQAMRSFEAKIDQDGMARAYYAYALLYRSNASHHSLKLPDNYLAGVAYKKAANLYHKLKNYKNEVNTLILAAIFFGIGTKVEKKGPICRTLLEAKEVASLYSKNLVNEVETHQRKMRCF